MVYCGPPSKGCSNCRDRKIRCDQREPGCGQCEKRQQSCPGYRNMVDLMFRDESSHVIKKAKARQRRKAPASRTAEPGQSPDDDNSPAGSSASASASAPGLEALFSPSPSVQPEVLLTSAHSDGDPQRESSGSVSGDGSTPLPLTFIMQSDALRPSQAEPQREQATSTSDEVPLSSPDTASWPAAPVSIRLYNIDPDCQERGMAFFFSRYVTVDENAFHQRFDFLYDIWKPGTLSAEPQRDVVLASMTAVGLVGISQLTHSEAIIASARKSYGTALCLTNEALRDETEAVKDTTMLSVLILSVFEMMAEPGIKTMTAWQNHITGAVILAKLRGVGQFQTRAGTRMFRMLCESVSITCMQKKVPMPPELAALQTILSSRQGPAQPPEADISKPVYELLQALHDINNTGLMDNLDVLLERMDAIEAEYERAVCAFPPDCRYRTLKVTRAHSAVFRDTCHVYTSAATASSWNCLRVGRIMALETVLSAVQAHYPDPGEQGVLVPPRYRTAFHQARRKLELINESVVASVPQYFGLLTPAYPTGDALHAMPSTAVPISTIEIREPCTPPAQSPMSSAGSVQTPIAASASASANDDDDVVFDDGGPSLDNPTRAQGTDEAAERYMLLVSATNASVWPLFAVGMSSVCTPELKAYVVSRLTAVFDETGQRQARSVAAIIRKRELIKSPWTAMARR